MRPEYKFRLTVFGWHCLGSAAAVAAALSAIFLVWYPPPLAALQAVGGIAAVIAIVDLGVGPLCTFVVASPRKSRVQLVRDVTIIGVVQVAALAYGLHAAFVARPAFIVYNVDRFDVLSAKDLDDARLKEAKDSRFARAPLLGPTFVVAVLPADVDERRDILFSAAQGGPDVKDMPRYYTAWPAPKSQARERQRDLASLRDDLPALERARRLLARAGISEAQASYVPIMGRAGEGIVVLRRSDLAIVGTVLRS